MPIRRATNGRWFFRSIVEFPDGTRKRISGMPGAPGKFQDLSNTKKGAEAAEARAKAEALTGVSVLRNEPGPVPAKERKTTPTIREFSETFLRDYRPADKPSARLARKQIINGYVLKHTGDVRLHEFQQKHIDHFVAALLPGRARKTVNNITAVLSSLMKYAGRSKLIDSDGLKDLRFDIESQKPEMQAVSADEIVRMMKVTTDIRYRVAILLAADAGLRIGEIRALTWENVNELQREIMISQSVDRTNALGAPKGWKTRTVPISERLWAELQTLDKVCPWVVPRAIASKVGSHLVVVLVDS